ncbi:MAG: ClpP family protease [Clostridium sp.]|jgi:ATP-dependent Clp protease protease subunit|nr:ATP-dependent Clp protease proteolytic subunit [bacterium MSK18_59]DAX07127.1 MAG TPA: ATP-dependent Clp protease proteolytic subunit [Bacteriophage sp.]
MEMLELPLVGNIKDSDVPSPEEYTYWKDRKNRTFYIDYEIDEDYSLVELAKIIIQMNIEEKDVKQEDLQPIRLFIHSYGGDIEQSLFFCDLVKASRIPIITIGMGVAMSAGFLIFLSGKRRYAFSHTSMLVHSGSAAFQGTAEQIEEAQKNYKKQIEQMKSYILTNTDIDEKTFNKNRNKDWYLSSDELLKYNIIDEVITDITTII